MKAIKKTLENGLRVITVPMPSVESATVTVWVRTGSRFEEARVNGISHFLEHMVFKGSKRRPSAKAIAEEVDSFGGEFNAGTSKEWTNFYIKARSAKIPQAFDVLADMVLAPLLKPAEIEREKGVIVEEIAMYEDTPLAKIDDVFENLMFAGSSLGWDVAGTAETVMAIKREDFLAFRKKFYHPGNIMVTASGGIKSRGLEKLAGKYFTGLEKAPKTTDPKVNFVQTKPQAHLKTKKTDQAHLLVGFRGLPLGTETRYAEAVLTTVLGGGMSSRMFTEVRERRGLCYAIKTGADHYLDNGALATYAGVPVKKIDQAIRVILDQYFGLASGRYKIGVKELAKAKEYLKGHLALSLEDTKDVNAFFGAEELLLGRIRTPEEVYQAVDKVTEEDVVKLAGKLFRREMLNLAVIGPFKDQAKFEKLLV